MSTEAEMSSTPRGLKRTLSLSPVPAEVWDAYRFVWDVKDYSTIGEYAQSQLFIAGQNPRGIFQMGLRPEAKGSDGQAYCMIWLKLVTFEDGFLSDPDREVNLKIRVTVLNAIGHRLKDLSGSISIAKDESIGWGHHLPAIDLQLLPHDKLRIFVHLKCQVHGQGQEVISSGEPLVKKCRTRRDQAIDAGSFLGDMMADVVLSTPSQAFLCNRALLEERSAAFQRLFVLGTDGLGIYDPPKLCYDFTFCDNNRAVEVMLRYAHTGDLEMSDLDLAGDLMKLAVDFELPDLKISVEEQLKSAVSTTTAVSIYTIARWRRGSESLQKYALDFILENPEIDADSMQEAIYKFPDLNEALIQNASNTSSQSSIDSD